MESIQDTIRNVIDNLETRQNIVSRDSPEMLIKKIFPKKEQAHIKFNYLKNGILNVKVDSSSWLYHFSLQKEDLLAKLRKKSKAIQEIRFHLGEIN
jgi:hypothetical protein